MASKNPMDEFNKNMKNSAKMQFELNKDITTYLDAIVKVGELQKDIEHTTEKQKKLQEVINKLKAEEKVLNDRLKSDSNDLTDLEKEKLANIRIELTQREKLQTDLKDETDLLKRQSLLLKDQIQSVNKLKLGFASVVKGLAKTPGLIKDGFGKLEQTGIFKVDKEIRLAGRSLNVSSKNADAFGNHLNKAAKSTSMMGVHTQDLANMQQAYSEEIGRSVVLTENSLVAMARMAEGTGLGKEGAAAMAASMDDFNLSVEASADYVEETVKMSAKMGVNSSKAVKNLQKNLKLAQKFHFKGGVKGLVRMANEAARLKLDMDGISGLAEKVFRPEGAVEMAAQLQVMGGEFAKLGDPMQLMFKARNDFEGFAKDIAGATIEFVEFNKETGETVVKGGLAADRMREIAKITGIGVEELTKMAGAQKRIQEFGSLIPSVVSDKEDRDMISSIAKMKDGKAVITLQNGNDIDLKDINQAKMEIIRADQEGLETRAKNSKSFDENIANFIETMKSTLLPIAQSLNQGFGKKIQEMVSYMKDNDWFGKIKEFMTTVGDGIKYVSDLFSPQGLLYTLLAGSLLKPAMWILNGLSLAKGFLAGTKGLGGVGGSGGGAGAGGAGASKLFNTKGGAGFAKNIKGAAKSGGAIGGGILAGLASGYMEYAENDEMGMELGENMGRTAAKGAGAGLGAWGGAAAGAAIGSAVPVVGTIIGGLIGGALGAWGGDALGEGVGDGIWGDEKKSGINSSLYNADPTVNDGIIKFNGNDKFMNVGNDTMIAGTNENGNKDLAKAMGGGGEVKHTFDNLKIDISLNSDSSWLNRIGDEIANDRNFVRDLTIKIQEEVRMAIGGGKLNPNPL